MRLWSPALAAWCRSNFFEQIPRKCFPQCLRPIVGPLFRLNSWNGTSALDQKPEHERQIPEEGGLTKEEERFHRSQKARAMGRRSLCASRPLHRSEAGRKSRLAPCEMTGARGR